MSVRLSKLQGRRYQRSLNLRTHLGLGKTPCFGPRPQCTGGLSIFTEIRHTSGLLNEVSWQRRALAALRSLAIRPARWGQLLIALHQLRYFSDAARSTTAVKRLAGPTPASELRLTLMLVYWCVLNSSRLEDWSTHPPFLSIASETNSPHTRPRAEALWPALRFAGHRG